MIEQGYFDHGFDNDKRVIADSFKTLGFPRIAEFVRNESNFGLVKDHASYAYALLMHRKLWDMADKLLDIGFMRRK